MKAIVTPLFVTLTLLSFGQSNVTLNETPRHIIDEAVAVWQANNADAALASNTNSSRQVVFENDALGSIQSVDRGLWSDASTWDCTCVPTNLDNVTLKHEVTLTEDASVASVILAAGGQMLAENPVVLTFSGDVKGSEPQPLATNVSLMANDTAGNQSIDADLSIANLTVLNRTELTVKGNVTVYGHVDVNDATLTISPAGEFKLGEDDNGRSTIMRTNGGLVNGELTREIHLAAMPNRDMALVEQRITTGLEGVTVEDFVGDIPTWGFVGADVPSGFSNIGYWSASASWNYATIASAADTLPVFEGIYLSLNAAESYTLTFSGTLPTEDINIEVPEDALNVLMGNATNANLNLNELEAQFGEDKKNLRCWNNQTLQFDHFIAGLSTNGLNATLQPNTTCEFAASGVSNLTLALNDGLQKGEQSPAASNTDGAIVFSTSNATGFEDGGMVCLRKGSNVGFVNNEDAENAASFYSACDLYLRDAEGNSCAIAQLDFDEETTLEFDLMLSANRPNDNTYTIAVDEMNWEAGCAFITLDGDAVATPLEEGVLTTVELNANGNNNYKVGTLTLVPHTRAEISSPGCDGTGETYIKVLPSGQGPWDIALSDAMGNMVEGTPSETGASVMYDDLASGTYTYAVLNNGNYTCGAQTGQHTVVRPTELNIETTVSNNCGEGGSAVANVSNVETVTYAWSNGQAGAEATGLDAGDYTVIATDAAGCADTTTVTVLAAPQVSVVATDGLCDGTDMHIAVESTDDNALWNFAVINEMGDPQGAAMGVSTPLTFNVWNAGEYTLEVTPLGVPGCGTQMREANVTQSSDLHVEVSATQMECGDVDAGAIELNVTGAAGNFDVAWNHGAQGTSLTDLAGGEYHAVVTDENGCTQEVEVTLDESPTVVADFETPSTGLNADATNDGFTVTFTNNSEGNFTGQAWTFVDAGQEAFNVHEVFTFEQAGSYDVMLEVWNDQCYDVIRKNVTVEDNATGGNDQDANGSVDSVKDQVLNGLTNPVMTPSGWMMDLGNQAEGMSVVAYDLSGRQLCDATTANGSGQIFVEGSQWPNLVLLRLVHEPTNSMRTWKMVR